MTTTAPDRRAALATATPCTTDADCLPYCFADCWPCNDAGDCDVLEAFGILAPKGDPRCFSVKNHSV